MTAVRTEVAALARSQAVAEECVTDDLATLDGTVYKSPRVDDEPRTPSRKPSPFQDACRT